VGAGCSFVRVELAGMSVVDATRVSPVASSGAGGMAPLCVSAPEKYGLSDGAVSGLASCRGGPPGFWGDDMGGP